MKNTIIENTTGVLLVGGQGRRMGYVNKSMLKANNFNFGEIALQNLSSFRSIILSAKANTNIFTQDYSVIYDEVDAGPLGAIYTVFNNVSSENLFVLSCDMPAMTKDVIDYVLSQADDNYYAIIPQINGRLEPLCGLYSRKIMNCMKRSLNDNRHALKDVLKTCPVKILDLTGTPMAEKFLNINYQTDYQTFTKTQNFTG